MDERSSERRVSYVTVVLIFGIVLIALGAGVIHSAYREYQWLATGYEGPYWDWDTYHLLVGIALSLAGTAVASASGTCILVIRKDKAVRASQKTMGEEM